MDQFIQVLASVRQRIERFRESKSLNEENTKATLVEPVIRALGWSPEDIDEVHREYKPKKQDKPVDYALLILRSPRLFIEVKARQSQSAPTNGSAFEDGPRLSTTPCRSRYDGSLGRSVCSASGSGCRAGPRVRNRAT